MRRGGLSALLKRPCLHMKANAVKDPLGAAGERQIVLRSKAVRHPRRQQSLPRCGVFEALFIVTTDREDCKRFVGNYEKLPDFTDGLPLARRSVVQLGRFAWSEWVSIADGD